MNDYFVHNIDFIALSIKKFRSKGSDDETILVDQTDYVWDPDWSHPSLIIIPTDISSAAITTNSLHEDYVKITPLTIDATPLNYNAMFIDRTGKNSLKSTFINPQETLNETRNLTQQNIQAPLSFVKKK